MMPDLSECTAFSLTSWLNVPTMHILHLRIFPRKSSMSRGRECHQNISKPQNVRLIRGSLNYGWGHTNISIFQEWLIDRTTQSNKQNRNSIANVWNMTWTRMNLSLRVFVPNPWNLSNSINTLISTSHSDLRGVAAPWLRPECEIWWWRHAFVSSNVQAVVQNWQQNIIGNPFECNNWTMEGHPDIRTNFLQTISIFDASTVCSQPQSLSGVGSSTCQLTSREPNGQSVNIAICRMM